MREVAKNRTVALYDAIADIFRFGYALHNLVNCTPKGVKRYFSQFIGGISQIKISLSSGDVGLCHSHCLCLKSAIAATELNNCEYGS